MPTLSTKAKGISRIVFELVEAELRSLNLLGFVRNKALLGVIPIARESARSNSETPKRYSNHER